MGKINLQLFGESEDEAVDILQEIDADYEGMEAALQVEVAKLAQLKRIADALEDLKGVLDYMGEDTHTLSECVGQTIGGDSYLRIGGSITEY